MTTRETERVDDTSLRRHSPAIPNSDAASTGHRREDRHVTLQGSRSTYRVEELVGRGGSGEVYRAIDLTSQRQVAVKVMRRTRYVALSPSPASTSKSCSHQTGKKGVSTGKHDESNPHGRETIADGAASIEEELEEEPPWRSEVETLLHLQPEADRCPYFIQYLDHMCHTRRGHKVRAASQGVGSKDSAGAGNSHSAETMMQSVTTTYMIVEEFAARGSLQAHVKRIQAAGAANPPLSSFQSSARKSFRHSPSERELHPSASPTPLPAPASSSSLHAHPTVGGTQLNSSGSVWGVPERDASRILYSVTTALSYLHSRHILHRDVKAANVLLMEDGSVKLSDFGLATFNIPSTSANANSSSSESKGNSAEAIRSNSEPPALPAGSLYWLAPEVLRGESPHTEAADIWSLGCLCVEILTGKPPFYAYSPRHALYHIATLEQSMLPPLPTMWFSHPGHGIHPTTAHVRSSSTTTPTASVAAEPPEKNGSRASPSYLHKAGSRSESRGHTPPSSNSLSIARGLSTRRPAAPHHRPIPSSKYLSNNTNNNMVNTSPRKSSQQQSTSASCSGVAHSSRHKPSPPSRREAADGGSQPKPDQSARESLDAKCTKSPSSLLSQEAFDFIVSCFQLNPKDRPTAEALRRHPWFTDTRVALKLEHLAAKQTSRHSSATSSAAGDKATSPHDATATAGSRGIKHGKGTRRSSRSTSSASSSSSSSPSRPTSSSSSAKQRRGGAAGHHRHHCWPHWCPDAEVTKDDDVGDWVESHLFDKGRAHWEAWLWDGSVQKTWAVLPCMTPEESFRVIRSFAFAAERCQTEGDYAFLYHLGAFAFSPLLRLAAGGDELPRCRRGLTPDAAPLNFASAFLHGGSVAAGGLQGTAAPRNPRDSRGLPNPLSNSFAFSGLSASSSEPPPVLQWNVDLSILCSLEDLLALYESCCACMDPRVPFFLPSQPRLLLHFLYQHRQTAPEVAWRCLKALHQLLVAPPADAALQSRPAGSRTSSMGSAASLLPEVERGDGHGLPTDSSESSANGCYSTPEALVPPLQRSSTVAAPPSHSTDLRRARSSSSSSSTSLSTSSSQNSCTTNDSGPSEKGREEARLAFLYELLLDGMEVRTPRERRRHERRRACASRQEGKPQQPAVPPHLDGVKEAEHRTARWLNSPFALGYTYPSTPLPRLTSAERRHLARIRFVRDGGLLVLRSLVEEHARLSFFHENHYHVHSLSAARGEGRRGGIFTTRALMRRDPHPAILNEEQQYPRNYHERRSQRMKKLKTHRSMSSSTSSSAPHPAPSAVPGGGTTRSAMAAGGRMSGKHVSLPRPHPCEPKKKHSNLQRGQRLGGSAEFGTSSTTSSPTNSSRSSLHRQQAANGNARRRRARRSRTKNLWTTNSRETGMHCYEEDEQEEEEDLSAESSSSLSSGCEASAAGAPDGFPVTTAKTATGGIATAGPSVPYRTWQEINVLFEVVASFSQIEDANLFLWGDESAIRTRQRRRGPEPQQAISPPPLPSSGLGVAADPTAGSASHASPGVSRTSHPHPLPRLAAQSRYRNAAALPPAAVAALVSQQSQSAVYSSDDDNTGISPGDHHSPSASGAVPGTNVSLMGVEGEGGGGFGSIHWTRRYSALLHHAAERECFSDEDLIGEEDKMGSLSEGNEREISKDEYFLHARRQAKAATQQQHRHAHDSCKAAASEGFFGERVQARRQYVALTKVAAHVNTTCVAEAPWFFALQESSRHLCPHAAAMLLLYLTRVLVRPDSRYAPEKRQSAILPLTTVTDAEFRESGAKHHTSPHTANEGWRSPSRQQRCSAGLSHRRPGSSKRRKSSRCSSQRETSGRVPAEKRKGRSLGNSHRTEDAEDDRPEAAENIFTGCFSTSPAYSLLDQWCQWYFAPEYPPLSARKSPTATNVWSKGKRVWIAAVTDPPSVSGSSATSAAPPTAAACLLLGYACGFYRLPVRASTAGKAMGAPDSAVRSSSPSRASHQSISGEAAEVGVVGNDAGEGVTLEAPLNSPQDATRAFAPTSFFFLASPITFTGTCLAIASYAFPSMQPGSISCAALGILPLTALQLLPWMQRRSTLAAAYLREVHGGSLPLLAMLLKRYAEPPIPPPTPQQQHLQQLQEYFRSGANGPMPSTLSFGAPQHARASQHSHLTDVDPSQNSSSAVPSFFSPSRANSHTLAFQHHASSSHTYLAAANAAPQQSSHSANPSSIHRSSFEVGGDAMSDGMLHATLSVSSAGAVLSPLEVTSITLITPGNSSGGSGAGQVPSMGGQLVPPLYTASGTALSHFGRGVERLSAFPTPLSSASRSSNVNPTLSEGSRHARGPPLTSATGVFHSPPENPDSFLFHHGAVQRSDPAMGLGAGLPVTLQTPVTEEGMALAGEPQPSAVSSGSPPAPRVRPTLSWRVPPSSVRNDTPSAPKACPPRCGHDGGDHSRSHPPLSHRHEVFLLYRRALWEWALQLEVVLRVYVALLEQDPRMAIAAANHCPRFVRVVLALVQTLEHLAAREAQRRQALAVWSQFQRHAASLSSGEKPHPMMTTFPSCLRSSAPTHAAHPFLSGGGSTPHPPRTPVLDASRASTTSPTPLVRDDALAENAQRNNVMEHKRGDDFLHAPSQQQVGVLFPASVEKGKDDNSAAAELSRDVEEAIATAGAFYEDVMPLEDLEWMATHPIPVQQDLDGMDCLFPVGVSVDTEAESRAGASGMTTWNDVSAATSHQPHPLAPQDPPSSHPPPSHTSISGSAFSPSLSRLPSPRYGGGRWETSPTPLRLEEQLRVVLQVLQQLLERIRCGTYKLPSSAGLAPYSNATAGMDGEGPASPPTSRGAGPLHPYVAYQQAIAAQTFAAPGGPPTGLFGSGTEGSRKPPPSSAVTPPSFSGLHFGGGSSPRAGGRRSASHSSVAAAPARSSSSCVASAARPGLRSSTSGEGLR